jgi:hypothetical protein
MLSRVPKALKRIKILIGYTFVSKNLDSWQLKGLRADFLRMIMIDGMKSVFMISNRSDLNFVPHIANAFNE